jgi:hypothetical protein
MNKIIIAIVLIFNVIGFTNAQVTGKTIGLRLGGGFGGGGEVSYQHPLGSAHRLEIDLGANGGGFGLNGIYHWVNDLSDLGDGFNWYYGVGAGVGSYTFDYNSNKVGTRYLNAGILGQIGLEYKFEIPVTISIDYRPGIYFLSGINSSIDGFCLSGRYRF